MPFGVSARDLLLIAEERRQSRRTLGEDSDGIEQTAPESIEDLNQDDGSGNNQMAFVLGLHDPFDSTVTRRFAGG
jgi:hypothetical protein